MALSAGVNLPPEAMKLLEGASDEALFKGLQALGLKLESRKAPLEVLVDRFGDEDPDRELTYGRIPNAMIFGPAATATYCLPSNW